MIDVMCNCSDNQGLCYIHLHTDVFVTNNPSNKGLLLYKGYRISQ